MKNILSVKNIVKTYPGVIAINDVSFDVEEGEIHALIGENGAGKSTLIKVLSGAIVPDSGTIELEGKQYNRMTPKLAKDLGIEVIYQEFTLVPGISAAENVFLGDKTKPGAFCDIKDREARAKKIFDDLRVDIDVSRQVKTMSPAHQQLVEIAKAVSRNVKILIMDEPTAPLTVSEVETLFRIVRELKAKGVTIIFISHRLEELFELADRVTVMRDGCYVGTENIKDIDRQKLITMMAGRELKESYPSRISRIGEEALRVEHLTGNGDHDISFTLHRGEILGFAGLVGAGRTETMRAIFGADPIDGGTIEIKGKQVHIKTPRQAIQHGIAFLTEDRKGQGLVLAQSIRTNLILANMKGFSTGMFLNEKRIEDAGQKNIASLRIKTPSIDEIVGQLSGGNQQKVVIGKWVNTDADIFIFDEPTRGIDVGAKVEVYNVMNSLVKQGKCVIMVSSEMPEILGMSDRVIVMRGGEVMATVDRDSEHFNQEDLMKAAWGGKLDD